MDKNILKENKDLRIMLKEAGILFAITLISGLILGYVYELTREPIRIRQEQAIQEACQTVFVDAAGFEKLSDDIVSDMKNTEFVQEFSQKGVKVGSVFAALDASQTPLGFVVEATTKEGYGGNIVLYAGIRMDGTLNGISLLEIKETPGLGMLAESVLVPQFRKVRASSFTYTKSGSRSESEIDAISGATVTTSAVVDAVNGAMAAASYLIEGGVGNE